jgi:hypothetical protein
MARAGILSFKAFWYNDLIGAAPSSKEYWVWTWRCENWLMGSFLEWFLGLEGECRKYSPEGNVRIFHRNWFSVHNEYFTADAQKGIPDI